MVILVGVGVKDCVTRGEDTICFLIEGEDGVDEEARCCRFLLYFNV